MKISENIFLRSIKESQRQDFPDQWNADRCKRERIYISYDLTNKNSQAGDTDIAEFGAAKVDAGLPIYGAMWDGNKDLPLSGGHTSNRFILVNSNDSKEKQTFTIAHEIGHFMMHCTSEHNFLKDIMVMMNRMNRRKNWRTKQIFLWRI